MAKAALGFFVGVLVGVGVLVAVWRSSNLTRPFTQDAIGVGTHSHMRFFVQELTQFHGGSFDMDDYQIWFRFDTRIATAAEYFERVDAAIRGSDWRLLDRHDEFSLYANRWEKAVPSAIRLEIALSFEPQTRTVRFEERRRYE
jgi:hypothetical protein